MTALPDQANKPSKIQAMSSNTTLAFTWVLNTDHDLPGGQVTGYKIWMDDGMNGDFREVFYAKNVPTFSEYIAYNLRPQRPYRVRIQAENFNGFGPLSDIETMYTCVPPTGMAPPKMVSTTSTSMTINWTEPLNNGGCPITGYAVFRDDGASEVTNIEVNVNNDPSVRDIPTLREVTATLNALDLGKKFKFMVRAFTREGFVDSEGVCMRFATVPPQPTQPTIVQTTSSSITV